MALSILFLKIQQYVLYFDVDLMLKQFEPQHQYLFPEKVSPIIPWAYWPRALSAQHIALSSQPVPHKHSQSLQRHFRGGGGGGHLSNINDKYSGFDCKRLPKD